MLFILAGPGIAPTQRHAARRKWT